MASRNNPLIKWLGISFDTFNLLHRWFGRIVAMEAVCHTLAFMAVSAIAMKSTSALRSTRPGSLKGLTRLCWRMPRNELTGIVSLGP